MKTQIEKLKKDLDELEAQYEKEQKENKRDKLHLEAGMYSGDLNICYKNRLIGEITATGKCYILNNDARVVMYEEWRDAGMPFSEDEEVTWRGGVYTLTKFAGRISLQRCDRPHDTIIYDFYNCNSCGECSDTNIIRFKHNNKPRLF